MTHAPVRTAIIGAGTWGTNHALALTTHPRCTVTLICDRDEARARRAGERFGCAWTTTPDEVAASDVEAVTVTRYGKVWGYQYEPIRYFVDCVADGLTPEASGADGLMVTAMIEATLRSLAEKRPVRIAEVLDGRDAGPTVVGIVGGAPR